MNETEEKSMRDYFTERGKNEDFMAVLDEAMEEVQKVSIKEIRENKLPDELVRTMYAAVLTISETWLCSKNHNKRFQAAAYLIDKLLDPKFLNFLVF